MLVLPMEINVLLTGPLKIKMLEIFFKKYFLVILNRILFEKVLPARSAQAPKPPMQARKVLARSAERR